MILLRAARWFLDRVTRLITLALPDVDSHHNDVLVSLRQHGDGTWGATVYDPLAPMGERNAVVWDENRMAAVDSLDAGSRPNQFPTREAAAKAAQPYVDRAYARRVIRTEYVRVRPEETPQEER